MEYEERYCAFVDVLGFSGLIDRLRRREVDFEFVKKLLDTVHDPFPDTMGLRFPGSDFQAQSISDAVAISTAANAQGLLHIYASTAQLVCDLLEEGYFARGAIVKGFLYQTERMVFGEALVDAYHFEHTIAKYPRILISHPVVADTKINWPENFSHFVQQADDGPRFLHVLMGLKDMTRSKLIESEMTELQTAQLGQYNAILKMINIRLEEATDNPAHFAKVQWIARYWNSALPKDAGQGLERVKGFGLDPRPPIRDSVL